MSLDRPLLEEFTCGFGLDLPVHSPFNSVIPLVNVPFFEKRPSTDGWTERGWKTRNPKEIECMVEPLADQILRKAKQAAELYHRLMLVVAPTGSGKTTALQDVRDRTGASLVNVNLELSRRMLELTERQRALQLPHLLREIISNGNDKMILLDNTEVIFDVDLRQDPLRLLQGLARNKTVVATWNGTVAEDLLIYATPAHPEYRRYPIRDVLVASPEVAT